MKIVFVIRSLANRGGIERTMTDKANYMASQGHEVYLVTYEQGQHKPVFSLNPTVIRHDLNCRKFTLYQYPIYKRLYKAWLMDRLMKLRWNAFVDAHRPDVVVITTYSDDFMSELMSVHNKTRIIVESHTAFTHDMCVNGIIEKIRRYRLLQTLKQCDLMIALTDGDKECWGKHIKNVKKVTNPVTHYIEDIENAKRKKGRIICAGRLHAQKRYDRLINAFALIAGKYPDWNIDIYGKGDLLPVLERQITTSGLEGRIVINEPSSDIFNEYLQSELFVLCSDYEGLPLVLLEAMACGVPSIATDCPFGPSEVIENNVTGLLCKMNEKDLADKMEWMITHEQERREMGKKAHTAVAKYKKENVMKEWENAYLSVSSNNNN